MNHIGLEVFDTILKFCSHGEIAAHTSFATVNKHHIDIQTDASKPYDLLLNKGARCWTLRCGI
jgi:hypothetical protein